MEWTLNRIDLFIALIVVIVTIILLHMLLNIETKKKCSKEESIKKDEKKSNVAINSDLLVLFSTLSGYSKSIATEITNYANLMKKDSVCTLSPIQSFEFDDYEILSKTTRVIFVLPTYAGGIPSADCTNFFDWLKDCRNDFRINNKSYLSNLRFSVVGTGCKHYQSDFCKAAKTLRKDLISLGAVEIKKIVLLCDQEENSTRIENYGRSILFAKESKRSRVVNANEFLSKTVDVVEVEEEDIINDAFLTINEIEEKNAEEKQTLNDIEDLVDKTNEDFLLGKSNSIQRGMVTKAQYKSLTKEGYKIIGTHSAVKLCRWTKHQLRGRGGCYKHTFYNIASYQCMEMTPSLACANKCVFCWRHHKNPVGTSWRWKQDSPEDIVAQAVTLHQQMVKTMNGVPGARKDRLLEAKKIRHCALSLVGEPIMYPRINELLKELHEREISSFLVTNGQFPEAIRTLQPVTQLYVSIDAADEKSLKAIDRPLFKDFWQRYLDSLRYLKGKGQRTVYRFTMVKQWNFEDEEQQKEIERYVNLIFLGEPDLIEIKAVTYCGTSPASSLTMENVPWHHEVRKFAEALCENINSSGKLKFEYGTACEHVHSCCTLLARKDKFLKNNKWMTWIDYPKFHELMRRFYATDGKESFTTENYLAETPSWALWGAEEEGFDPNESRYRKKRNHKNKSPRKNIPK